MAPTWIAEESVVFVHPDGRRVPGRIAVGLPGIAGDGRPECATLLDGIGSVVTLRGEGTLQTLALAMQFVRRRLEHFTASGGRVLYPPEEGPDDDVPIEALFGQLPPSAPPAT